MKRLESQVAIVTGGASGLGAAIVARFIEDGARVAILDKSEPALEMVKKRFGDSVVCVAGDVRSVKDCQKAVSAAVDAFGKLDCAIGNAGIWDYNAALADLAPEALKNAFDELFQVNVLGYVNLAKAALRDLVASKGSIILTLSNAAFYPAGGGVLYTATKHAGVGVVRQLAHEFAPHVRVNAVAPGAIPTKLKGPASLGMENADFPVDMFRELAPEVLPVGRLPECEDYAGAYVFLASRRDNAPTTGAILNHDGGIGVIGVTQSRAGDDLPEKLGLQQE